MSLRDSGADRLGGGNSSDGARLGGDGDTLVDNGLNELVASDGLGEQRRVERVAALGVLLALNNVLASLEKVLGAAGLDLGDVVLVLGDRSEVCGSRDGGGWCSCNGGLDTGDICLSDNVGCSGEFGPFPYVSTSNFDSMVYKVRMHVYLLVRVVERTSVEVGSDRTVETV